MYEALVFLFFEYRTIDYNVFCIIYVIFHNDIKYIMNITDLEKK